MKVASFVPAIMIIIAFYTNSFAQNDQTQGQTYVKIKTMKIVNGDTIVTEKEYTGDGSMTISDSITGNDFGNFNFSMNQFGSDSSFFRNFNNMQDMFKDFNFGMNNYFQNDFDFPEFHHGFFSDSIIRQFNFNGFDSLFPEMDRHNIIIKSFRDSSQYRNDSDDADQIPGMDFHLYGKDNQGHNTSYQKKILIEDVPSKKNDMENNLVLEIEIFPNPSGNYFNVTLMLDPENKTILTITDMDGNEILQESVNKSEGPYTRNFDLGTFTKGTYIINIKQGKKEVSKKIIIS